ncbi:chromate transporter [uncultured Dialister sp.]|mgnify:FL=1|jgi:chromate transporter|uniref:chromate transporter n=1 Tax=uncultured Dialister sp. TaxID=278064 RepID=UPI0025CB9D2C|nr:chromate transporter [uncultured Dialister sp.]
MIWLQMFWEFFKAGLFAVGGGLATLPFLYDISQRTGWFTAEDIANMIAISESTPGPLGVNMATYAGFQALGIPGGIYTTLSLTAPALIVISMVYAVLKKFKESDTMARIFYGLRPASTALIAAAGLGVAKISLLNLPLFSSTGSFMSLIRWPSLILAVIIYLGLMKFRWHPVIYIAISAVAGVVLGL